MVVTAHFNFGIMLTFSDKEDMFHWLYMKPWARFSSYGVGAIFGLAYFEYTAKDKLQQFRLSIWAKIFDSYKNSAFVSCFSSLVGIFMTSFIVFIQYSFYKGELKTNTWPTAASMFYNAFARTGFVVGLTLIILPTFVKRFSWIKSFLGSDFMCVLGRLTYAVYLMHIPWMNFHISNLRQGVWLNNLNIWIMTFAVAPISFMFAIPFSMISEVPFMNIEKYFLMPNKRANVKKDAISDESLNDVTTDTIERQEEPKMRQC
jgi:peptidoglycan/LPS O-acetylase OafA/YrhL